MPLKEYELADALIHTGRMFTGERAKIEIALDRALKVQQAYREMMRRQGLTAPQAIARMFSPGQEKTDGERVVSPNMTVALIDILTCFMTNISITGSRLDSKKWG